MPSIWTKKSIDELKKEASDSEHGLRRTLGPLALMSLGIGAIVGAGIFVLSGVAAQHTGPALVGSVILSGVGCAFAGLCYAEFSSMIPVAGSAYTYAYATVGEFLAWIIGWDLILEYAVGATTVSIGWSGYLVSFLQKTLHWPFPAELSKSPWETLRLADGTVVHPIFNLPAAFIVILITTLLIIGIRESANFNSLIVMVKVGVVLLFIFFGALYVHRANWHPFLPANQGTFGEFGLTGVLRGAGIIFFAYIGFDAVSTAAQEARNPERDMPIGILGIAGDLHAALHCRGPGAHGDHAFSPAQRPGSIGAGDRFHSGALVAFAHREDRCIAGNNGRNPGDDAGPDTRFLFDGSRWLAAKAIRQDPPPVSYPLHQHSIDGSMRRLGRGALAPENCGRVGQHWDAAGFCHCVGIGDGNAQNAPRDSPAFPHTLRVVRRTHGDDCLLGTNGGTSRRHLVAFVHLDGDWSLCLLWLRSPAQCPAKPGKAARARASCRVQVVRRGGL